MRCDPSARPACSWFPGRAPRPISPNQHPRRTATSRRRDSSSGRRPDPPLVTNPIPEAGLSGWGRDPRRARRGCGMVVPLRGESVTGGVIRGYPGHPPHDGRRLGLLSVQVGSNGVRTEDVMAEAAKTLGLEYQPSGLRHDGCAAGIDPPVPGQRAPEILGIRRFIGGRGRFRSQPPWACAGESLVQLGECACPVDVRRGRRHGQL